MTYSRDDRPLGELFTDLVQDTGTLVRQEVQLAKAELTQSAAQAGKAVAVHPAKNAAASPLRYEMDGMEQYKIQSAIEDAGHELGAIYHSHTRTPPFPSQTDINLAFYPEALYVIVGVAGDEPDVRAFRIVEGEVSEQALEVVG